MSEDNNNSGGWYEQQQETPDGKKKAPEHVIASNKAQIAAQNLLAVPMVKENTVRTDNKIPEGWQAGTNGYNFRKVISEEHTTTSFTTRILLGSIKGSHGTLTLWVYSKDLQELAELQEKVGIMEARLTGYTVADPAYVVISGSLHDALFKIRKLKKDLAPSVSTEKKLEETFHDTGYEQDRKARYHDWCIKFMEKANEESKRIDAEINKKDPTGAGETDTPTNHKNN